MVTHENIIISKDIIGKTVTVRTNPTRSYDFIVERVTKGTTGYVIHGTDEYGCELHVAHEFVYPKA